MRTKASYVENPGWLREAVSRTARVYARAIASAMKLSSISDKGHPSQNMRQACRAGRSGRTPKGAGELAAQVVAGLGSILVAFIALSGAREMAEDAQDLRIQELIVSLADSEVLPSSITPPAYFGSTEIPTTITGKTDRRPLRQIGVVKFM